MGKEYEKESQDRTLKTGKGRRVQALVEDLNLGRVASECGST